MSTSTTQYGVGTDPIGLDPAKFELTDIGKDESPEIKDINKGNGQHKQGDIRKIEEVITLKYFCETLTPETDAPAIGATCSGYDVIGRSFAKPEGHNTMTLKVRRHRAVTLVLTQTAA